MVGAAAAAGRGPRRHRFTGVLLALLAIGTALVLLAGHPDVLVELTSDRDGRALLPASTLAPGTATSGEVTLANEGLLPLRYDLRVRGGRPELSSGVVLRVRRNGAPGYLYQGPLPKAAIPIGTLAPGQRDRVEVTLAAPRGEDTASIPVDDTFVWTGHPPGIGSWSWLLLVVAGLLAGAFGGPRALALWSRLRARRQLRAELYWRPPLVLSAVLLATLLPLSGLALGIGSLQAVNPPGRFGVGELVLSDQAPARAACLSEGAASATPSARCGAIFGFDEGAPGQVRTARITIRNVGTLPVGALWLASGGCDSQPAATAVHGTADGCAAVLMTVHDDRHDVCYFPVRGAGACAFDAAGSMRAFAVLHGPEQPLALDPDGLGSGVTYSFAVEVDPAAGNGAQGLAPLMDLAWRVTQ